MNRGIFSACVCVACLAAGAGHLSADEPKGTAPEARGDQKAADGPPVDQYNGIAALHLLGLKSVRKELKLSDDAARKIDALAEASPPGFVLKGEFDPVRLEKAAAEAKKTNEAAGQKALALLSREQRGRLKELWYSFAGPRAVGDPAVARELGLSKEQSQKLRKVLEQTGSGGGHPPEIADLERQRRETDAKLLSLLTEAQSKKLEKLKGAAFEFDPAERYAGRSGAGGPLARQTEEMQAEVRRQTSAFGLVRLLELDLVQKEIGLSDDQKQKFNEIVLELRAGGLPKADAAGKKALALLTDEQRTRLTQIRLWVRGSSILGDPAVAKELGLSDAQIARIGRINRDEKKQTLDTMRAMLTASVKEREAALEEIRQESEASRLEVLSVAQKEKLEKLKGPRFEFDPDDIGFKRVRISD